MPTIPFDDSIRTAMTARILVTFSSRLAGGCYDLQKHAWVCSGSPAGINSIVCHNKKVQNFVASFSTTALMFPGHRTRQPVCRNLNSCPPMFQSSS
jgi:hypothetical protein